MFADHCRQFRQVHCSAAGSQTAPQIVLTREQGKNGKLATALQQQGLDVIELPLVETAVGPDRYGTCFAVPPA